jgi:hypothetical protein
MAVLACRIQPPLQDVAADDDRARDGAVPGDLRIGTDIDQRRAGAHGGQRSGRLEAGQVTPGLREQVIDRGSCHERHLRHMRP